MSDAPAPGTIYRLATPAAPPCGICGELLDVHEWIEMTTLGDVDLQWTPARATCPTPRCGEVCRICRRDVGDVHGPHCGPLMFAKLERPHIITREDCR